MCAGIILDDALKGRAHFTNPFNFTFLVITLNARLDFCFVFFLFFSCSHFCRLLNLHQFLTLLTWLSVNVVKHRLNWKVSTMLPHADYFVTLTKRTTIGLHHLCNLSRSADRLSLGREMIGCQSVFWPAKKSTLTFQKHNCIFCKIISFDVKYMQVVVNGPKHAKTLKRTMQKQHATVGALMQLRAGPSYLFQVKWWACMLWSNFQQPNVFLFLNRTFVTALSLHRDEHLLTVYL